MSDHRVIIERPTPRLLPLGDRGLLIRFSDQLDEAANAAAIALASRLHSRPIDGVVEIVPSLVSVLVRYDPLRIGFPEISGALRLILAAPENLAAPAANSFCLDVSFGGADGPDLGEVARLCGLDESAFIGVHNRSVLRVLATGFAPGFVYCGLHPAQLNVPRRDIVHAKVPAGSVLFAAGQTAITATDGPTGWHVIGRTDFRNFDTTRDPPTSLRAGDNIQFVATS